MICIKRVIDIHEIRSGNRPYLLIWIMYYAWALVFVTTHTMVPAFDDVYSVKARTLIHGALLLCTAAVISVYRKPWFVKIARTGAVLLLCALSAFLFFVPVTLRIYVAPVAGAAMGLICVGILIPFIFILNNTEKFYAVVVSNLLLNVLALFYQVGWMNGEAKVKLASFFLLFASLLPILWFKTAALSAESPLPKPKPQKITYFTLGINFMFAIAVLGFGKLMMDHMPAADSVVSSLWHVIGGLLGCGVYWLVFAFIRKSLQVTWNVTFACFFLATLYSAIGLRGVTTTALTSLLLGVSGTMGMINMFYNVGVIGQKFGNRNHLKQIFWLGVAGGGFCILLNRMHIGKDINSILITALVVSSAMVIFYFIISPILARTYFEDEWVDDSEAALIAEFRNRDVARIGDTVSQRDLIENLGLAPREKEVCALLLKGLTIRQIAGELGLAFATVNGYYRNLYKKLGIGSKGELFMRFGAEPAAELNTGTGDAFLEV
ncbi:hypothetical protein FACS18947_5170 [Bacteroidia bacterium]|nr:hypothetical protein FACS18947_5170 [Bacteroidia bacterium]